MKFDCRKSRRVERVLKGSNNVFGQLLEKQGYDYEFKGKINSQFGRTLHRSLPNELKKIWMALEEFENYWSSG